MGHVQLTDLRPDHIQLTDLRPDHIHTARDEWQAGQGTAEGSALSNATVFKHLVVLRGCLSDAVISDIIPQNPMEGVRSPSLKRGPERRALEDDEIKALLEAAQGSRYDVPIRFTLATGLRRGELLSLSWRDCDLDHSVLYCRGTKSPKSRRTIELSAPTVSLLQLHRKQQFERRIRLGAVWQEHGLVFPSLIGTPWIRRGS